MRLVNAMALVGVLTGCATVPAPEAAPPTPTLEHYLSDAAKARMEGAPAKERESYHAASRAYPAAKEPWQRLAESYFQAADYGNAILAAQEVAQRDPADELASGILAVSGLRVSTSALATLRQQQRLNVDTRAQAEDVVKSLRDLLGEPVLVPKPVEAVAATPPAPAGRKRRGTTSAVARPPMAAAAPVAAPANPSVAPAPKANPFDKLK